MAVNIISRAVNLVTGGRSARAAITDDLTEQLLYGSVPTAAGRSVDEHTALHSTVVYACVRVVAETVASLPLITYRRLERGRDRALQHPLYPVLHDQANPEMTAMEFRETMLGHALLWGSAYAEIERAGGNVRALWPLRPDMMTTKRDADDQLMYEYRLPTGQTVVFAATNILHLRGFGSSGITAQTPIGLAREAVGFSQAVEEYGARFFGNDSRPGGILTTEHKLSPEAAGRLKASWEALQGGLKNRHRVAVLEQGVTWQQIGIPPQDAQFLETRKFQTAEIARMFRVPLHMIGDLERATFSNIEHQSIEFVQHTIRPWCVRFEQVAGRDLFTGASRGTYYAEHLVDGLLRGDAQARAAALAVQRQNGIITANEWREIENRNPVDGGDGLLVNGNMIPVDQAGRQPARQLPPGVSV